MSERFEQLYKLQDNLYIPQAPIIISAGFLFKDTETENIIAQIKFQSVSEKKIIAVKISLTAFDLFGKSIQGVDEYQYLDLNVKNGQYFGANKAIVMPSIVARAFSVESLFIMYDDHSVWECKNCGLLQPLPTQKSLHSIFDSSDLLQQYRISTCEEASKIPIEYENLWLCACGEINSGYICTKCSCKKTIVFDSLEIEKLEKELSERVVAERAKKEEQERIVKAEKEIREKAEQERTVRNKKRIKLFSIIAFAAIIVSIGSSILISNLKYNNTISKIENCINDSQFETAFDYIIGENIKEPERNEYLEIVIPKMKERFAESKEADVVLVFDDCSVVKEGRTLYLKNGDNTIEIYTLPEDTAKYEYKNGHRDWQSGSRYEIEDSFIYAGGYILFVQQCDTVTPNASAIAGFDIDIDISIKAYNIEKDVCRTLVSDTSMEHFVKLIDGRVVLNTDGAVFNPYTGECLKKSDIMRKKDEDDYIYPYEYEYSVDYIYKIE